MRIEFSSHALDQFKHRPRITKHMVLEAVSSPDHIVELYRGRRLYQKIIEVDTLEVAVKEEDNKHIIITEYFWESEP